MQFPKQSHIERVAAKDATRHEIKHPWIKGDNLYATNGRIAVRIPIVRDAEDTDGQIHRDACKEARKKTNDGRIAANSSVSVGNFRSERDHDGTFFDVDQVIPKSSSSNRKVRLNASMLLDLAKALGSEAIEIELPEEENCPLLVRGTSAGEKRQQPIEGAVGAIMPIAEGTKTKRNT